MTHPTIPFYLVDVFAASRYVGNPLAVFDEAGLLDENQMLQIAREVNFQETTFITGGSLEAGFNVKIFTPEYEVPFAGHPTLGTAYVLANHIARIGKTPLTLNLGVGPITLTWQEESVWLKTAPPQFGSSYSQQEIAQLLHITPNTLVRNKPVEWISTGLPYLIIPVHSLDTMRALRLDAVEVENWLIHHHLHTSNSPDGLTTSFYCYCEETYEANNQLNARMFCLERGRVMEDYATGSAASCLLAYLLKNRSTSVTNLRVRLEQGYEVGRPSLIELDGNVTDDQYNLRIGGQVHFIAKGEWTV